MVRLNGRLLACLFLGFANPVLAEREVHVVAVGVGYQTDDYYALPEARVLVNRPGQEIGLVLLDGGELHWKIEVTPETIINEIVRSGPSPRDSEVSLSGIPMDGVQVSGLPLVFRPLGRDFRNLVDILADTMGTEHISSFQGAHKVGDETVRVDHVDTITAGLARDYLSQELGASGDLPPRLKNWISNRIENGVGDEEFTVAFDKAGLRLTGPAGVRRFPVTSDVPAILLPVVGVYDPTSETIYCITYGAEGYLYSVDVRSGVWQVVAGLEEYDAAGLLFDRDSRQIFVTGAFSRPGEIRIFGLDGSRSSTFIATTDFPGLTDLFNYGNEHGPPLIPRVFSEGWLLVDAYTGREGVSPNTGQYRIYGVQVETGAVRLLYFDNG